VEARGESAIGKFINYWGELIAMWKASFPQQGDSKKKTSHFDKMGGLKKKHCTGGEQRRGSRPEY